MNIKRIFFSMAVGGSVALQPLSSFAGHLWDGESSREGPVVRVTNSLGAQITFYPELAVIDKNDKMGTVKFKFSHPIILQDGDVWETSNTSLLQNLKEAYERLSHPVKEAFEEPLISGLYNIEIMKVNDELRRHYLCAHYSPYSSLGIMDKKDAQKGCQELEIVREDEQVKLKEGKK